MPTNSTVFNSRVTDENLEKKFRDTFTSQGGAELMSDLYAQGVIVPVVDFTDAATGSVLRSDLQTALDESVSRQRKASADAGTTTDIQTTAGFYRVDLYHTWKVSNASGQAVEIKLDDGTSTNVVAIYVCRDGVNGEVINQDSSLVVYIRPNSKLTCTIGAFYQSEVNIMFRQIADAYGNLTNPLGFVSQ